MNGTLAPADTALWKRLNALLEVGMALPESERRAWLDTLPEADADLKPRLEAMLARADSDSEFMAKAAPFTALGLEPGSYKVSAWASDLVEVVVEDVAAGTDDLLVVLPWGDEIAGRVIGVDGAPVPLAELGRVEPNGDVLCLGPADRDGRFSLRCSSGTRHTLVAWAPDGSARSCSPAQLVVASTPDVELVVPGSR